jgi:hypothetical protein
MALPCPASDRTVSYEPHLNPMNDVIVKLTNTDTDCQAQKVINDFLNLTLLTQENYQTTKPIA